MAKHKCDGFGCVHCQQKNLSKIHRKAEHKSYAELWIKAWKYAMLDFRGNLEKLAGYGLDHENVSEVELKVKMLFGPWMDLKRNRYPVGEDVWKLLKSNRQY